MIGPSYVVILDSSTAGERPHSADVFVDGKIVGSTRFIVADEVTGPEQRDDQSSLDGLYFRFDVSFTDSVVEIVAGDVEEVWELSAGLGGTPDLGLVEDEPYTDWYY